MLRGALCGMVDVFCKRIYRETGAGLVDAHDVFHVEHRVTTARATPWVYGRDRRAMMQYVTNVLGATLPILTTDAIIAVPGFTIKYGS